MITVVHLITSLDTGGAEMMLCRLIEHSDRSRFRHIVVSLKPPGPVGARIEALGVPVSSLQLGGGIPDPRAFVGLVALLRREKPDIVQSWLYHADALAIPAAAVCGAPVVWNLRSAIDVREFGPAIAAIARVCTWLSHLPAAIVTNSQAARIVHTRLGYHPRRWQIIPNGFDVDRFQPDAGARESVREELGLPPETVLIGLVARYDPLKDHRTLLQAAGLLRDHPSAPHLVLVGRDITPANAELRSAIETARLSDRVHLLGERHDIPRLTAALDIAVCSSYGESFPNVIGEAMACGVPCAMTDVGDAREILGDTGLVVPARQPRELAGAISELLDLDPEARQALGLRARIRVAEHFSLAGVVRQYEALYQQVAASRKPAE